RKTRFIRSPETRFRLERGAGLWIATVLAIRTGSGDYLCRPARAGSGPHGGPVRRAGLTPPAQPRHKEESMTMTKIQSAHCERIAFVYVRQSTPLQVIENRESTERQYHLRDRAIELGWPPSRVEVIDEDQGRSG